MEKSTVKEHTTTNLVVNIKANGLKIKNQAMEQCNITTRTSTKASGSKANAPARELTNTQTATLTQDIGKPTPKMATASYKWQLATNTREVGSMVRRTAKVNSCFLFKVNIVSSMAIYTTACSAMVIAKVRGFIHGLITAIIKVSG